MTTKAELQNKVKALNKARILQGEQCGHLRSWIHLMSRVLAKWCNASSTALLPAEGVKLLKETRTLLKRLEEEL